MSLSRRHFLISGAAAIGACFLPSTFLRRLARFPAEPAVAIDPPASARRTLYATRHDDDVARWQLALGRPTTVLRDTQGNRTGTAVSRPPDALGRVKTEVTGKVTLAGRGGR
ncbi:MAG: hypothetical protein ACKPB0_05360 [Opitutaceae bacterium]